MQKLTRFLALLGELMIEKPKTPRRRLLSLTIATTRCHRASNVGFRWPTASCSCNSPHCFGPARPDISLSAACVYLLSMVPADSS